MYHMKTSNFLTPSDNCDFKIETWFSFIVDFISEDAASGVIQALVLAMGKVLPKSCKKLCKHLLEAMKDQQDRLTESESFCRTLEVMMALSADLPKIFKSIYETFYHEKLVTLAKHPIANFSVQKLITNCHDKEMVSSAVHWICIQCS